jgi:hypothetical protein
MMPGYQKRQFQMVFATEMRQFLAHPRCLHLIPLLPAGIMLVLWSQFTYSILAVILVVLVTLEPQFQNILFRTKNEFESLQILAVDWRIVILAKNLAALVLFLLLFVLVAATTLFFAPKPVNVLHIAAGLLYASTILFPLFHVGNLRSIQHPRRISGWQTDDLAGAVELLIYVAILSLPYLILTSMLESLLLTVLYSIAGAIFWWRHSLPTMAQLVEARTGELCLTP